MIGGGPAGLAAASELLRRNIRTVILEQSDTVGSSWRAHPENLHLHTTRLLSGLPGQRIPRRLGRYPANVALYEYLRDYATDKHLRVRYGVKVTRIQHARPGIDNARWLISTTSGQEYRARTVVVATGYNNAPYIPDWPGASSFRGTVIHSSKYHNASRFLGYEVLVVGAGNAAAEIAVDLISSGAKHVYLAVRTPPHVIRRDLGPWPSQLTGLIVDRLPEAVADRAIAILTRLTVPSLQRYGLRRPRTGMRMRLRVEKSLPLHDTGSFITLVEAGKIQPVPSVADLYRRGAHLVDGTLLPAQFVIAATGYRRGLGVLLDANRYLCPDETPRAIGGTEAEEGLYFMGFTLSLGGALRQIGQEAKTLARAESRKVRVQMLTDCREDHATGPLQVSSTRLPSPRLRRLGRLSLRIRSVSVSRGHAHVVSGGS